MTPLISIACPHFGAVRWNLGLDSPNKAAILLVCVLILATSGMLFARRRWVALASAAAAIPVVYAFLRTLSRGGFAALSAGLAVLAVAAWRKRISARRWIALLLAAAMLSAGAVLTGFAGRLACSAPSRDASVGNRLVIWRAVPEMMVDSPGGWGLGNAGSAFMGWYQPLSRHERYRTLVNSHFTWLVEFGWGGRFLYTAGWIFALLLCIIHLAKIGGPLPLALWSCLGTGALFSSVAEEWYVWLIPATAALPVVRTFIGEPIRGKVLITACSAAGGAAVLALIAACAWVFPMRTFSLHRSMDGRCITVGDGRPAQWITFDGKTMGGDTYGRALRAFMNSHSGTGRCFGIAQDLAAVPDDASHLAICGAKADAKAFPTGRFRRLEELRVLSPANPEAWLRKNSERFRTTVICGDLAANCPASDMQGLKAVPGAGDYLPDWPELAFAAQQVTGSR